MSSRAGTSFEEAGNRIASIQRGNGEFTVISVFSVPVESELACSLASISRSQSHVGATITIVVLSTINALKCRTCLRPRDLASAIIPRFLKG